MRTESLGTSYLALPDGPGPHPGVVIIHEASGGRMNFAAKEKAAIVRTNLDFDFHN